MTDMQHVVDEEIDQCSEKIQTGRLCHCEKTSRFCDAAYLKFKLSYSTPGGIVIDWSTARQLDRPCSFVTIAMSHHDPLETSSWSWSLESDTTILADYTLTTTAYSSRTTGPFHAQFLGETVSLRSDQ